MSSLKVFRQPTIPVPDFGDTVCTVIVYQHADFTGWQVAFGEGDHDYKDFTAEGNTNDDASSVRVRGMDCKATLFEDAKFKGWAAGPLDEGDFTLRDLKEKGFVNDDMSSLKVFRQPVIPVPEFGAPDCTVIVYQHADWTGWQVAYGEGDFNYKLFTGAGAVNDDASSARVRGQDCKVTFFEHGDFTGWAAGPLEEGDYDLTSL